MIYTHGHHESVLRSHRVRTAANSCAYLLPHLSGDESLLGVGWTSTCRSPDAIVPTLTPDATCSVGRTRPACRM